MRTEGDVARRERRDPLAALRWPELLRVFYDADICTEAAVAHRGAAARQNLELGQGILRAKEFCAALRFQIATFVEAGSVVRIKRRPVRRTHAQPSKVIGATACIVT